MPDTIGTGAEKPEDKLARLQTIRTRLVQKNEAAQQRADALRTEADRLEASMAVTSAYIDKIDAAIQAAGRP